MPKWGFLKGVAKVGTVLHRGNTRGKSKGGITYEGNTDIKRRILRAESQGGHWAAKRVLRGIAAWTITGVRGH